MEILETGKLKSDFLEKLLGKIEIKDEKVVVGPGIGEDAAALDIGENYLLVKSDPITFVSDRIGWYSVNVNANDIAAMGGTPRWFLVTIMLPEGRTTPGDIEDIMSDLRISCEELGIVLIGGHTEITHGLKNPILSGTMLGEAKKGELIRNGNIEEGDLLYMTKGVAIEATSIIAREKKEDIIRIFGRNFYTRCINFLEKPGLSVVGDAYRARSITRVSGMHDPTEGGILAGAFEMARCSQKGLEIYLEKIPVYEETKKLCEHFHISPYGSIASGSLLISVAEANSQKLEEGFGNETGVMPSLSRIGRFTQKGKAVYAVEAGRKKEIYPSSRDEVTKLL